MVWSLELNSNHQVTQGKYILFLINLLLTIIVAISLNEMYPKSKSLLIYTYYCFDFINFTELFYNFQEINKNVLTL